MHQRQPDAQPAFRAVERPFRLREELEDTGQEFGGYADPCVPHPHYTLVALGLDGQPNVTAFMRVLGRVHEQVDNNLFQPRGVGIEPDRLRWQRYREFVLALVDERTRRLHRAFHDAAHGDPIMA